MTANAQWTVTNLHPSSVGGPSEALGVSLSQQVGSALVSGSKQAVLWNGSALSWVNLNPSGSTISEALGVAGNQQTGYAEIANVVRAGFWSGSSASWVELHPAGANESVAQATDGTVQVGYVGAVKRASMWSGNAASRISLHPDLGPSGIATISSAYGVADGQQVGVVVAAPVGEALRERASLWSGIASSWIDLSPPGSAASFARGVSGGQQVGWAVLGDGLLRASLWSGSPASWVDLSPAGASGSEAWSVSNGFQVGYARIQGGPPTASLWSGTAASWVNLGSYLPANYTESYARSIAHDPSGTFIVGSAYNVLTGRHESILWAAQSADSDNDGLSNDNESAFGTNPNDPDTDDDGLLDGTEVDMAQGSGCPNPLVFDSDYDGLSDGIEVSLGTSPCDMDTDDDGILDGEDPTPLVPGVPGTFIEEALRTLSAEVLSLSLTEFEGPNNNAKAGRRNAISSMLVSAANRVALGDTFGAIDVLSGLLLKVDIQPNPPDWIEIGVTQEALFAEVQLLIALLEF